jgi:hypothetical protein
MAAMTMNHEDCRRAEYRPGVYLEAADPGAEGGTWHCGKCGTRLAENGAPFGVASSGFALVGGLIEVGHHGDLKAYGLSQAQLTKRHRRRAAIVKFDWYPDEIYVYCTKRGVPDECGEGQHLDTTQGSGRRWKNPRHFHDTAPDTLYDGKGPGLE